MAFSRWGGGASSGGRGYIHISRGIKGDKREGNLNKGSKGSAALVSNTKNNPFESVILLSCKTRVYVEEHNV